MGVMVFFGRLPSTGTAGFCGRSRQVRPEHALGHLMIRSGRDAAADAPRPSANTAPERAVFAAAARRYPATLLARLSIVAEPNVPYIADEHVKAHRCNLAGGGIPPRRSTDEVPRRTAGGSHLPGGASRRQAKPWRPNDGAIRFQGATIFDRVHRRTKWACLKTQLKSRSFFRQTFAQDHTPGYTTNGRSGG